MEKSVGDEIVKSGLDLYLNFGLYVSSASSFVTHLDLK